MCAEIINLHKVRKQKAKDEKARQADQNRISFGRTKSEKQLTKALNDKAKSAHDQGRIEKDGDDR